MRLSPNPDICYQHQTHSRTSQLPRSHFGVHNLVDSKHRPLSMMMWITILHTVGCSTLEYERFIVWPSSSHSTLARTSPFPFRLISSSLQTMGCEQSKAPSIFTIPPGTTTLTTDDVDKLLAGFRNEITLVTDIVFPDSLQHIGAKALSDFKSVGKVVLPPRLKSIAESAFGACHKLAYIEIPSGCTELGLLALAGCSKLAYIEIPDGCVIGKDAFLSVR
jgi:hypothetical protein